MRTLPTTTETRRAHLRAALRGGPDGMHARAGQQSAASMATFWQPRVRAPSTDVARVIDLASFRASRLPCPAP